MSTETKTCVVFTTCPTEDDAQTLARALVEANLAACVQITGIVSYYRWKGAVNRDQECLLLIKTRCSRYGAVEEFIRKHHGYEVPEIIRMAIDGGLPEYLNWIYETCG
ncbi:MAG TPA: divalent-cation tolerance protein CutA [Deltaproteobacteria bacterium]|nr:divalent-cation tolerance protein CutA [Deltaproteobacteria bacterium]